MYTNLQLRAEEEENNQWWFSKGFDGNTPVNPALMTATAITDPQLLEKALHNGAIMQDWNVR